MRILNLLPDQGGGIESYYEKLRPHLDGGVEYFVCGKRPGEHSLVQQAKRLLTDYLLYWIRLRSKNYDLVVVNPSLETKGILREGLFILLASICDVKCIVFFHGWRPITENQIEHTWMNLFMSTYGIRTSAVIVLADTIRKKLIGWGLRQNIYLECTVVDDQVSAHDVRSYIEERLSTIAWRILFLARIGKSKGIYEALDTFKLLVRRHPEMELMIAGDGEELANVKQAVVRDLIPNVTFYGYVRGVRKDDLYRKAHCYLLPSYTEGMPNTVLEAMAFGLPVITRPVGGIKDFFENGRHGFATWSLDPLRFAAFIETLHTDRRLWKEISFNNRNFALSRFLASDAAQRLESIYREVIGRKKI